MIICMQKKLISYSLIVCFLLLIKSISAKEKKISIYSDTLNKNRLKTLLITGTALYSTSMIGLYNLWYKQYPQTSFHFINDIDHWRLMDKMGHFFSTYNIGRFSYASYRWTGLSEKKAIWYSALSSISYLTFLEIMDGFSAGWGFSFGDVIANTAGTALFISQQLIWNEQRIVIKYSFHQTIFPNYRPELLGKNFTHQLFDDYNGITIWTSINIKSFLQTNSHFPKWLNIALGYGAEGLLYGNNLLNYTGPPLPVFDRTSQFYLAPDIDLTKIHTHSKFVHIILNILSFIKIPLPTFEINTQGKFKFHLFYF